MPQNIVIYTRRDSPLSEEAKKRSKSLVSALGGRELILNAYRHAVAQQYRFYSYGDCMLLL